MPVGADLNKLESDGYFDADALAAAKKQKAVNTTKPFLIYRDPKLYDKTTRTWPITPPTRSCRTTLRRSKSDIVKMKPAPSDDTVYYLTVSIDLDWGELPDADVK